MILKYTGYYLNISRFRYLLKSLVISCLILCCSGSIAQIKLSGNDTLLSNLADTSLLTYDSYTDVNTWGNYTSHNYKGTEEYGEKYYIEGEALVKGIVSYHYGDITTPEYPAEFCVYDVGENHFPKDQLGKKEVTYGDIDLNGNAMVTYFDEPIAVTDSFFVSFNLFDYFHRPFSDTIGVYYGEHGSRAAEDAVNFGRNVVRKHYHGPAVWVDFSTQNFTNIMTHLAIFPIVEFPETVLFADSHDHTLKIYPNPTTDRFYLPAGIQVDHLTVWDMSGRIVVSEKAFAERSIDVGTWPAGTYLVKLQTPKNQLFTSKLIVKETGRFQK